jgi:mercuric ion binding protein
MKYFIALSLFCFSCAAFGQKKAELTFNVDGVCGMCETRIEKAYDIPGILNAEWNVETKKLTVAYKTDNFSVEQLHAVAARAGHDTDIAKATDQEYAGLHGCCKYRDGASCGSESQDQDH